MDYNDPLTAFGIDPNDVSGIYDGPAVLATATGVPMPADAVVMFPGDIEDAQQMEPWNPAGSASPGNNRPPWWAGAAVYGITRALDNVFPRSPTGVMGNTSPGTGAGASGRTYQQRPTGAGGGVMSATVRTPLGIASAKGSPLVWLAGLAVLYVLMK